MAVNLDLADIQGNILVAYGIQGYYKGRIMLFHIDRADSGRKFVNELLPMITTAQACPPGMIADPKKLPVAINIAFTWYGLLALDVPIRTLRGMPDEFIDGMVNRAPMLGDDFHEGWKGQWDEVWTKSGGSLGPNPDRVHILVTLNAQMDVDTGKAVPELASVTSQINNLAQNSGGVTLLTGHNPPGRGARRDYQDLSLIIKQKDGKYVPIPKEHFGFTDGIGDPVFEGQYSVEDEQAKVKGNGALDGEGNWRPLATGEFLLGYPDEAQEIAGAAMPLDFSRNGTFMAYRKLYQNVAAFTAFMDEKVEQFRAVSGIENVDHARETLMAKMAGRWSDGVPISLAPTWEEWDAFNKKYPNVHHATDPSGWAARNVALANFSFGDDPDGIKCPLTAHMRRVNTRDMLGPSDGNGTVLTNRRRILRRGLLYGDSPDGAHDTDEQGVLMLILCASLFRQFEFVQQQWINYGLDAGAGSDTCPIVGNHSNGAPGGKHGPKAKFVIPADPASGKSPFIVEGIPQFVDNRGGEYFFVPSMTALRMIGMGVVDPT